MVGERVGSPSFSWGGNAEKVTLGLSVRVFTLHLDMSNVRVQWKACLWLLVRERKTAVLGRNLVQEPLRVDFTNIR